MSDARYRVTYTGNDVVTLFAGSEKVGKFQSGTSAVTGDEGAAAAKAHGNFDIVALSSGATASPPPAAAKVEPKAETKTEAKIEAKPDVKAEAKGDKGDKEEKDDKKGKKDKDAKAAADDKKDDDKKEAAT